MKANEPYYKVKSMSKKIIYQRDGMLYVQWKLLNAYRLLGRDLMRFQDIIVPYENQNINAFALLRNLRDMKLELCGWVFHFDIYKKYCSKECEALLLYMKDNPEAGFSKSVTNIIRGKFTIEDVEAACFLPKFNLVEWFEFDAKLPQKTSTALKTMIDSYLDSFIADTLSIETINFYRFEKQKQIFIKRLKIDYLDNYTDTFIYRTIIFPPFMDIPDYENEELFIHTLVALEKLGYLKIEAIWVFDMDLPPEKQTENYKVKMTVTEKLRNEAGGTASPASRKQTSSRTLHPLTFDSERSVLSFRGKDIEIAKGKNTTPHYLLGTIFKDKDKLWCFDEIAEDWEHRYVKNDWRRYYNAAYSVNEKVEKKTGIKGFLDISNKSVCIRKEHL